MQYILIVGQSFSGLTSYLKDHGYSYIVLKDAKRTKLNHNKVAHRVLADFSSRTSTLEAVRGIKEPIAAVMTVYENYILHAAWIAEALGLPGPTPAAAEACTDKTLMRACFAKSPEPISPDFAEVDSEEALRTFASGHSFPLVLKPASLAKSLLVTRSYSLEELLENYRRSVEQITKVYQTYGSQRTPKLLVEEFLEGSVHSVDAFVSQDGEPQVLGQITDYETGYDIGYNDTFCYSRTLPSKLSPTNQKALRHSAALGIKALGLTNSPAHVEIIMTPKGPRIVEIGARNGGYRERMHRLANDIDIIGAALDVAFGRKPDIRAHKNDSCAVIELYPKQSGIFKGISHEEGLKALPSLAYYAVKTEPGHFAGLAGDGFKMCAIIILHNADVAQFAADKSFIDSSVHAITTP